MQLVRGSLTQPKLESPTNPTSNSSANIRH
jgi:hypothetical protein